MERLDKVMMARGMASSRERAQQLIEAGAVQVAGRVECKPGMKVAEETEIVVTGEEPRYVGRGGSKLEAALRQFGLTVEGAVCLDVGASTGGFTDCLLQHGAKRVVALDVGHGQLVPALREDPRVECREGVNARYLTPEQFPMPFDLVVADVSFISLTLVLPALVPLIAPEGFLVALVKPQFEGGRAALDQKGIVRDAVLRRRALAKVLQAAEETDALHLHGSMDSPLLGGDGNAEFLACWQRTSVAGVVLEQFADTAVVVDTADRVRE